MGDPFLTAELIYKILKEVKKDGILLHIELDDHEKPQCLVIYVSTPERGVLERRIIVHKDGTIREFKERS